MVNESKEFLERKKLIELDYEYTKMKHDLKMEQLKFERETSKQVHDQILERGRIQRAEERKTMYMKERIEGEIKR